MFAAAATRRLGLGCAAVGSAVLLEGSYAYGVSGGRSALARCAEAEDPKKAETARGGVRRLDARRGGYRCCCRRRGLGARRGTNASTRVEGTDGRQPRKPKLAT